MATGRMLRLLGLIVVTGLISGCPADESQPPPPPTDESVLSVSIMGETFELELALDDATRVQGLSDRASMPDSGGMLFVFSEPRHRAFVMRRCLFPIDLLFLDAQGKVIWMHAMQVEKDPDLPDNRLKPYISHYPAQFAIELTQGSIQRLGLRQGDQIDLPLEELKHRTR